MSSADRYKPYYKPLVKEYGSPATSGSPMSTPGSAMEKKRRSRTQFTPEQMALLEHEYTKNRFVDEPRRASLAERLALDDYRVKIWFQNRRAKDKREGGEPRSTQIPHQLRSVKQESSSPSLDSNRSTPTPTNTFDRPALSQLESEKMTSDALLPAREPLAEQQNQIHVPIPAYPSSLYSYPYQMAPTSMGEYWKPMIMPAQNWTTQMIVDSFKDQDPVLPFVQL